MKNLTTYDILKNIGQVIMPAVFTCVLTILKALDYQYLNILDQILMAILTCYNTIIVVWNSNYYKNQAANNTVTTITPEKNPHEAE